ncbi:MAG: MFS transporter [Geminicoccaceae bacterium]
MAQTTVSAARGAESWLVVTAACISTFVVAYNSTAILTALPAIKSDLDMDAEGLQWVMNGYMLASAVLVAVMGRFADIFGKMRMYMIGLGIFSVGSIAIIFSDSTWLMLLGRTGQGVGAAAIFSTAVALITVASPEEKRAQALGLWAGMVAFGFGVGPLIGGIFTDSVGWRGIFAVDLLLLAVTALLCLRIERLGLVDRDVDPSIRIDYWGVALLVATLGSFVYGLTNGHQAGWTSPETLSLFAIAIAGAIGLAFSERRAVEPLINFSFFRSPRYSASAIGMFLTGFVLIGVLYYYNLFVQSPGALNYTAVQAGLSLLPCSITMFVLSITVPKLLAPYSFHWPVAIGMILMAIGFWLLHFTTNTSDYASIWWKLLVIGLGLGLTFALLPRVGLRGLPDKDAGQGSGVINTCLYLGACVGTAAGGIVTARIRHDAVLSVIEKLHTGISDPDELETLLAHGSESEVKQALAKFNPEDAEKIRETIQSVLDDSFAGVMDLLAVTALLGAIICFFLIRGTVPKT